MAKYESAKSVLELAQHYIMKDRMPRFGGAFWLIHKKAAGVFEWRSKLNTHFIGTDVHVNIASSLSEMMLEDAGVR